MGKRRGATEREKGPARGESGKIEKMKNSGNEAKKWLKTKDITFFNGANHVCFACKFAPIAR